VLACLMRLRLAALISVLAALAFAPAGAQAANVIRTTSVTKSAVVPPGGTSTRRLECPAPWIALSGAVTSKGTGVTRASSSPGNGAGDWRFRFAADSSARRTVRTVLRCVRLEVPAGISGARVNVQTRRRLNIQVPVGGTTSVAVRCGSRSWVATGYGFSDRAGTVRLASVVPAAHGWRFVLENVGASGALADVSARCLKQTVTAGSAELRFRVTRPAQENTVGLNRLRFSHRCGANRFSLATGSILDPDGTIELAGSGPTRSSWGRWTLRQASGGERVRTVLVCLTRGTGFN
jgi:hypothetical protein